MARCLISPPCAVVHNVHLHSGSSASNGAAVAFGDNSGALSALRISTAVWPNACHAILRHPASPPRPGLGRRPGYHLAGWPGWVIQAELGGNFAPADGHRREGDAAKRVVPSLGRPELGAPFYRDSFFDLAFINACRVTFGRLAGWQSERSWAEGYLGMVEVSHALMRGRTAQQQQQAVLQGFPRVPPWFRRLFPYSDWGAEVNARITPLFFQWLVGPCKVEAAEGALRSVVAIERCRYLDSSGCTAMCVNLCKGPTQYFFTQELGMPLTMEPNFETLGCRMIFGQTPPPPEEDPAFAHPCFASCPSASVSQPSCPKLR